MSDINLGRYIGFQIRELRKREEMPQEKLASQLGITRSALSRLEAGDSTLTPDKLFKLAKIFNVDVAEFFPGQLSEEEKTTDKFNLIVENIRNNSSSVISKNDLKIIGNYIASRIKDLRKDANMSQEDVASQLGMTPSALSRIETGTNSLTTEKLFTLACLFNVDVAEFFPGHLTKEEKKFEPILANIRNDLASVTSEKDLTVIASALHLFCIVRNYNVSDTEDTKKDQKKAKLKEKA